VRRAGDSASLTAVALVRILIDGYSLLHSWPELAPGAARHSATARDALIAKVTQYRDATHTPITIIFDGQGAPAGTPKQPSGPELEILYSKAGKTADDMIERVTYRMRPYGQVLVITDDYAERDTVISLGGFALSCAAFIGQIEAALGELAVDLKRYNRDERERFRRGL
jgi:predicted RNA-binding protein with PIN domain